MVIYMKVHGKTIFSEAKLFSQILKVKYIMENGIKASKMDKEEKNGQMELYTKDFIKTVIKMDMESFSGHMVEITRVSSWPMNYMGKVNIFGMTAKGTKENSNVTKWTEKVYKSGLKAKFMMVRFKMIINMDMVNLRKKMVVNMKEAGKMANNTELVNIQMPKGKPSTEYGQRANKVIN